MSNRLWMQPLGLLALFAALCLTLTGCGGSKVTKENADKIKTGMTEAEVTAILGTATSNQETPGAEVAGIKTPSTKASTWKDGNKQIVVTFVDGKAIIVLPAGF